jgi:hypothetical protein
MGTWYGRVLAREPRSGRQAANNRRRGSGRLWTPRRGVLAGASRGRASADARGTIARVYEGADAGNIELDA